MSAHRRPQQPLLVVTQGHATVQINGVVLQRYHLFSSVVFFRIFSIF